MYELAAIFWLILGVIFIIAELFTLGLFLLSFGIGALLAALFAYIGFGMATQIFVFFAVSTVMTVFARMIFQGFIIRHKTENTLKSGIENLPGQIGIVVNASAGAMQSGAVKVFGSTWTAFPADGEMPLIEGERVEVVRLQGSSIYVRRIDDALPSWRQDLILPEDD